MTLATPHPQRHNAPVPFNSGSEFGDSNSKADSRLAAIFTSVCNTIGASISMAGRGGDTFGYAGSDVPVRQPRHAPATPVWRRTAGLTLTSEATMPSITRALSRLFPISSTISTAATMAEAQTIARQHLARTGRSVRIAPASVGFSVVEVR
jgi:hypothetical protein